jgi:hypothetical protein
LSKATDENQREILKTLLDGVMPTLKAAELDTALDIRGPNDKGAYTLVGGIKIQDGVNLERSFLKAAARFPQQVTLDVEKADQIHIHRINPEKNAKTLARQQLGDNPAYIAFRENVLFLGAGENGLSALKEALAIAPRTGKVMELQIALARAVRLFDDKKQVEIARDVFGDSKDGDQLRISVEGGDALTLRLLPVPQGEANRFRESRRESEEAVTFPYQPGAPGTGQSAPERTLRAGKENSIPHAKFTISTRLIHTFLYMI